MRLIFCTAASMRAMLDFIDPETGGKVACKDDDLTEALIKKIRDTLDKAHGGHIGSINFKPGEDDLQERFEDIAKNISDTFLQLNSDRP